MPKSVVNLSIRVAVDRGKSVDVPSLLPLGQPFSGCIVYNHPVPGTDTYELSVQDVSIDEARSTLDRLAAINV
jgi:hypothetical protein